MGGQAAPKRKAKAKAKATAKGNGRGKGKSKAGSARLGSTPKAPPSTPRSSSGSGAQLRKVDVFSEIKKQWSDEKKGLKMLHVQEEKKGKKLETENEKLRNQLAVLATRNPGNELSKVVS